MDSQWQAALAQLERVLDGRPLQANPTIDALGWMADVSNIAAALPETQNPNIRQQLAKLLIRAGEQLDGLSAVLNSSAWGDNEDRLAPAVAMTKGFVPADFCAILTEKGGLKDRQPLYRLAVGVLNLFCGPGKRLLEWQQGASPDPFIALALETQLQTARSIFKLLTDPDTDEAVLVAISAPNKLLQRAATWYAFMLKLVTKRFKAMEPHRQALQADSELAQQLYKAALMVVEATQEQLGAGITSGSSAGSSAGLPSGSGGVNQAGTSWQWPLISDLLIAIGTSQFHSVMKEHAVQGSGSGAAHLLHKAAAVLRQLQATGEEEVPSSIRRAVSLATISLAGTAAANLLTLSRASFSSLPLDQQQMGSTVQLVPAAVEALHFLPLQAAALQLLGNDGQAVVQHERNQLAALCAMAGPAIKLARQPDPAAIFCEGSNAAAWCCAADACLRLLPLLMRLQLDWVCHPPAQATELLREFGVQQPASKLATSCIEFYLHFLASLAQYHRTLSIQPAAMPASGLWQLHTTACRLVHWAAKLSAAELRVLPPLSTSWDWLLSALHDTFHFAFTSNGTASNRADAEGSGAAAAYFGRRMQSMAAAQALALPLVAGRAGKALDRLETGCDTDLLSFVIGVPPSQLDPQLLQAFQQTTRQELQLEGLLASATELCDNLLPEASRQLKKLQDSCQSVATSAYTSSVAPESATAQVHLDAIASAQRELNSTLAACRNSAQAPTSLAAGLQQLQHYRCALLPPATALAAALAAYWDTAEVRAAHELELAQAVAGRSCANLRCANLEAGGGPGAGQGVGSKKCSACRSVWYCSTACSQANWRQRGHKRVCKQLAAARQQQREEGA